MQTKFFGNLKFRFYKILRSLQFFDVVFCPELVLRNEITNKANGKTRVEVFFLKIIQTCQKLNLKVLLTISKQRSNDW